MDVDLEAAFNRRAEQVGGANGDLGHAAQVRAIGQRQRAVVADGRAHQRRVRVADHLERQRGCLRDGAEVDQVFLEDGGALIADHGEVVEGLAEVPDLQFRDGVGHVHSRAEDLAEDGEPAVLVIEVRAVVGEADEQLAGGAVRVAAHLGHRDRAAKVRDAGLVEDRPARADFLHSLRLGKRKAAALHDEIGHRTVHEHVGVVAGVGVGPEVGHGDGRGLVEQVHVERAHVAGEPVDAAGDVGVVEVAREVDDGRRGVGQDVPSADRLVDLRRPVHVEVGDDGPVVVLVALADEKVRIGHGDHVVPARPGRGREGQRRRVRAARGVQVRVRLGGHDVGHERRVKQQVVTQEQRGGELRRAEGRRGAGAGIGGGDVDGDRLPADHVPIPDVNVGDGQVGQVESRGVIGQGGFGRLAVRAVARGQFVAADVGGQVDRPGPEDHADEPVLALPGIDGGAVVVYLGLRIDRARPVRVPGLDVRAGDASIADLGEQGGLAGALGGHPGVHLGHERRPGGQDVGVRGAGVRGAGAQIEVRVDADPVHLVPEGDILVLVVIGGVDQFAGVDGADLGDQVGPVGLVAGPAERGKLRADHQNLNVLGVGDARIVEDEVLVGIEPRAGVRRRDIAPPRAPVVARDHVHVRLEHDGHVGLVGLGDHLDQSGVVGGLGH